MNQPSNMGLGPQGQHVPTRHELNLAKEQISAAITANQERVQAMGADQEELLMVGNKLADEIENRDLQMETLGKALQIICHSLAQDRGVAIQSLQIQNAQMEHQLKQVDAALNQLIFPVRGPLAPIPHKKN